MLTVPVVAGAPSNHKDTALTVPSSTSITGYDSA